MTTDVYSALLEQAAGHALAYLSGLGERPVRLLAGDEELRELLGGPLPQGPGNPEAVLEMLVKGVERGLAPSGNGRYYGYVVGGTLPVAMAADWLTSAWDQNCIVHDGSPATAVAEEVCADWLLDLLDLPRSASVAFVPACTHGELLCLAAARHKVLAGRGWNVAEQGLQGAPRVRVLANADTHSAVLRCLQILGLGGSIEYLATDDEARIRSEALRQALAAHDGGPLIVCGQVGEINTGGVDRLGELCDAVHEAGGWVHLDAAIGMWAAASPQLRGSALAGIERADSWAADAHKWLNTPYDCGVAIISDPVAHRAAVPLAADYLNTEDGRRHPAQWGLEISRRSRVFPLWATLRTLGRDGVAGLIDGCRANARLFAELLAADPTVEVLNEVTLNQVLVRFYPQVPCSGDEGPEAAADAHTDHVAELFRERGRSWASSSQWRGRAVLRFCLINWATTAEDVRQAAASLLECHHSLLDG
ncbi:aspartate aminotransferase family protein [Streptomyces sp. NRRL B-1677]|uniref:pyridoxal phosphate-dependent decarboxylase family protein n=1 Tax=Streptomyces sp. NRRL B-1677 TaxID=2682966 RepID=UPI001892B8B9|nr:pyridoxal-dependent decarboxylase [Streptomyces sp. NRRL B-1677]MBF6050032.1 aspartate aminotransferase family protein [Streptomyces sp. NRRL B-1677]